MRTVTYAQTLNVPAAAAWAVFSDFGNFFEWNGKLYFDANAGNGSELWETDGTTAGTKMVHEINPSTTR